MRISALLITVMVWLPLVPGPAGAQGRPFAPVVDALVNGAILPAYDRFAAVADDEAARLSALCKAPSPAAVSAARDGFVQLVAAFAAIEPYRFGPAREANRYERLFFWPDRRSRGVQQVQRVIATEDPTATDPATLPGKSVALQGLNALEFALYGSGSDTLATTAGYRCDYAATVAGAIATVARELAADWHTSFAAIMTEPGDDNALYRSDAEALEDILQAAAGVMEIGGAQKLTAVIGAEPARAKPKRAPFWRSNQTLPMIIASADAVRTLLESGAADLFETDTLMRSANFDLMQIDRALAPLAADPRPFVELVRDPDAHRRLAFAAIQLDAARHAIADQMQGALGLVAGFNALDGD